MTGEPFDERYTPYREHAALRETVTELKAQLSDLPRQVSLMVERMNELTIAIRSSAPSANNDTMALALHHLADAAAKMAAPIMPPSKFPTAKEISDSLPKGGGMQLLLNGLLAGGFLTVLALHFLKVNL